MNHNPVLLHEVIEALQGKPGDVVIDGTLDGGGHAREIIKRIMPGGMFIGIDADPTMIQKTSHELREQYVDVQPSALQFFHSNYENIPSILQSNALPHANALLLDLGFSSMQIDDPDRGMSFQHDGPLDMRYDRTTGDPASIVVNTYSEQAIGDILMRYGQERYARKIARKLVEERKIERITTTLRLAKVIEMLLPRIPGKKSIHPATQTFQALRIYVNQEFEHIEKICSSFKDIMVSESRIAIISFHSLEDRMIKQVFSELEKEKKGYKVTKKPIIASQEEIDRNPRSRSAKLRVFHYTG